MPAAPPVNHDAVLAKCQALTGPYFRLTFRNAHVARNARPGQFVMIKAGSEADMPLRRPFSILSVAPDDGTFDLFVKAVGEGSRALVALAPGGRAQCLGPLGEPFPEVPAAEEALMVAGGYGIAPFVFLAGELRRGGGRGRVFYGGRTGADLQLRDEFRALGTPLSCATDDGSEGVHGRVTAGTTRRLP
jgi:dihydroorotate dehydrogenase electron transfer subunit